MIFFRPMGNHQTVALIGFAFAIFFNISSALADCQAGTGSAGPLNGWQGTEQADDLVCDNDPSDPSNGQVETYGGDDLIVLDGATLAYIYAGNDNDTINLNSGNITGRVLGGAGEDTITLDGATIDVDIIGGVGNDKIYLYSGSVTNVLGEDLKEPDGDDLIVLDGATVHGNIGAGGGKDRIELKSGSVQRVFGGSGEDFVRLNGAEIKRTILTGDDADRVELYSGTIGQNVETGAGNDIIILDGVIFKSEPRASVIDADGGNDHIELISGEVPSVMGDFGEDTIILNEAEDGDLKIEAIYGGDPLDGRDVDSDTIDLIKGSVNYVGGGGGGDVFYLRGATVAFDIFGDWYYQQHDSFGDDIFWLESGTLGGDLLGDQGSDTVHILASFDLQQIGGLLDGGDDASIEDGFIDELTISASGSLDAQQLLNWEKIIISGADLTWTGNHLITENADDYGVLLENALLEFDDDFVLDGDLSIDSASALIAGATDGTGVFEVLHDLSNQGGIDLRGRADDSGAGDLFKIGGNYTGGGTLQLDVVLNDGTSQQTDKLVINGNTSGTTRVFIDNHGGLGGFTGVGPQDGIRIVEVNGASNGTFELGAPAEAGGYSYSLNKADGQNWHLQTQGLSSTAVLAPQIPKNLRRFGFRLIGTWSERVGGLSRWNAPVPSASPSEDSKVTERPAASEGFWSRSFGASGTNQETVTGGGQQEFVSYDDWYWAIQAGIQAPEQQTQFGSISFGGFAYFGQGSTDGTNEDNGASQGSYDTSANGGGASLTLLSPTGLYADIVASYTRFKVDLTSARGSNGSTSAGSFSVSAEAGSQHIPSEQVTVTPLVQLVYQNLKIDDFVTSDGTSTHFSSNDGLTGRASLNTSVSFEPNFRVFSELGLLHEFLDAPAVSVNDWQLQSTNDNTSYLIEGGLQWTPNSNLLVYARGGHRARLGGDGQYSWTMNAGLRQRF